MILVGDVLEKLREIQDGTVQTCVTSPPYWGLRDYGVSGQIGLERTPEEYVAKMVHVFAEVRRVLQDDGTLWLNLGDCYASSGGAGWQGKHGARASRTHTQRSLKRRVTSPGPAMKGSVQHASLRADEAGRLTPSLKPKDLVGMPWRVAFALQADGWYLRQDIIWAKPNPMPESVRDRCTKAHEYVFLLSKSERYFFDAQAIEEPVTGNTHSRGGRDVPANWNNQAFDNHAIAPGERTEKANAKKVPSGWDTGGGDHRQRTGRYQSNGKWSKEDKQSSGRRITDRVAQARANGAAHDSPFGDTRNKRSVWTITTQAYPEAHFATFPEEIPETCIRAGSRPGDTVLDPFAGSGTTLAVAAHLGRKYVGIELNPEYAKLIRKRLACVTPPMFPEAV